MLLGFQKQFRAKILSKFKRHTIRAKRKIRPRVGETCHLYVGLRQKGAELLGRFPCTRVQDVRIHSTVAGRLDVWIDGELLPVDETEGLARHDGFESMASMADFWKGRLPFVGDMIHWDPDKERPAPGKKKGQECTRKVKKTKS